MASQPKQFKNLPKKDKTKQKQPHQRAWEYLSKTQVPLPNLSTKGTKLATTSALTGSLLLAPGTVAHSQKLATQLNPEKLPIIRMRADPDFQKSTFHHRLARQLAGTKDEQTITRVIKTNLGIDATTALEGQRLNIYQGVIGAEQHLRRFPGDSTPLHDAFPEVGLAPRSGAWGLFAPSQEALSDDLVQKEKYYFAVQTFLAPGWSNNSLYLKDWFKYRKMLAINPKTGQAVVGVVADAGPASWTGKQFGGSPEVMDALGLAKTKHGEVILLFVDEKENKIPLGPQLGTSHTTLGRNLEVKS